VFQRIKDGIYVSKCMALVKELSRKILFKELYPQNRIVEFGVLGTTAQFFTPAYLMQ
jgi:hypothetical protein